MKRLYTGLVLLFISLLLLVLLFVPGYLPFYWSNPGVFITFTVIGVFAAFFGALLVRKHIFQGMKRETYFFDALVIIGDGFVLVGLCGAAAALLTASAIAVNPMNWGKYYGTGHGYNTMILASQEMAYWVGVTCMAAGQFIIGLAHKRKIEKPRSANEIHPFKPKK
jgi:hypothetical protein